MGLNTEELKKIEIEMLDFLDNICSINGIHYYLYAGTLLGAVRHKGFIPWDDDIDIALARDDYEKLKSILKKQNGIYQLVSDDDEKNFYLFSKLVNTNTTLVENDLPPINNLGVYVDIFPLDNLPNDNNKRKRYQKKIHILRVLLTHSVIGWKNTKTSILAKFVWVFGHILGTKKIKNIINKSIAAINKFPSEYFDVIVAATNPYRNVRKIWFNDSIRIQFEDKMYSAPKEYDAFLTELYGDYMKLPNKEKQVSNHNFIAEYKNIQGDKVHIIPLSEIELLNNVYLMLQQIDKEENAFTNDVKDLSYDQFIDWVKIMIDWSNGINLPIGYVKQSTYIAYLNDVPVGIGKIRHELTETTRKSGGNIGFAIAKQYRGRGFGTKLMNQLVSEARMIGVDEIIATVKKDNLSSQKAIERNGGLAIGYYNDFIIYSFGN